MSRIGKSIIALPEKVELSYSKGVVEVKGPKGALTQKIDSSFELIIEGNNVVVKRPTEQKRHKALHGLYRALVSNMVKGVSEGFKTQLELVGVGFKASHVNNVLELNLGYSHNIYMGMPEEVSVFTETLKGQAPKVILESNDNQLLGQVVAKIRGLRKVEPYKGKGVRFVGEIVRRKAGKTSAK